MGCYRAGRKAGPFESTRLRRSALSVGTQPRPQWLASSCSGGTMSSRYESFREGLVLGRPFKVAMGLGSYQVNRKSFAQLFANTFIADAAPKTIMTGGAIQGRYAGSRARSPAHPRGGGIISSRIAELPDWKACMQSRTSSCLADRLGRIADTPQGHLQKPAHLPGAFPPKPSDPAGRKLRSVAGYWYFLEFPGFQAGACHGSESAVGD